MGRVLDEPVASKVSPTEYTKLFQLDGKTAVVTGSAGILGRHFCRGLAEFGAKVAVLDLNAEGARNLAKELRDTYNVDLAQVCISGWQGNS